MDILIEKNAEISLDEKHRFTLSRIWDNSLPKVLFIGLNPSTADASKDDATVRRCISFANEWKYGGFYFGNLFSYRTRFPKELIENLNDGVRKETDEWLRKMISDSDKTICAWGSYNMISERKKSVLEMIKVPYCLCINKDGNPRHPLFSRGDFKPLKYN